MRYLHYEQMTWIKRRLSSTKMEFTKSVVVCVSLARWARSVLHPWGRILGLQYTKALLSSLISIPVFLSCKQAWVRGAPSSMTVIFRQQETPDPAPLGSAAFCKLLVSAYRLSDKGDTRPVVRALTEERCVRVWYYSKDYDLDTRKDAGNLQRNYAVCSVTESDAPTINA